MFIFNTLPAYIMKVNRVKGLGLVRFFMLTKDAIIEE